MQSNQLQVKPTGSRSKPNKPVNTGSGRPNKRVFRHYVQLFRYNIPTQYIQLAIIELIILLASPFIGHLIRFEGLGPGGVVSAFGPDNVLYAIVMQLSLLSFGCYQHQANNRSIYIAARVAASLLVGLLTLTIAYYLLPPISLGRGELVFSFLTSLFALISTRIAFRKLVGVENMRLKVLVLGAGRTAKRLRRAKAKGELDDVRIYGFVPATSDSTTNSDLKLIYYTGSLAHCAIEMGVDTVVLALDERRQQLPVQELMDCRMSGIEVLDISTFFERNTGKIRLDSLNPSSIFLSDGFNESGFRRFIKRLFDLGCVLLLLPVALPISVLAAIAILIESRGKGGVLYSQSRVGANGKVFKVHKFRSMVVDAEPEGVAYWATEADPRITRVGRVLRKYHGDELPQLYNILKGEMSFVGPRPERPEFVEHLGEAIPYYNERHRVKPGLSGWAQIRFPYGDSEEDAREKFQYDLYYIKNYSIMMDLFILMQTIEVVLLRKGAQ